MRMVEIVAICAALGGCGALQQEVAARPNEQFVGQNVDVLVARFGRPERSKRLDDGQASYIWQLAAPTDVAADRGAYTGGAGLYGDGRTPGYISFDVRTCRLSVTTSPEGIITQFTAEDLNGTGAPAMTIGLSGSVCAQRLGANPRT